jgi:hypothetical protein
MSSLVARIKKDDASHQDADFADFFKATNTPVRIFVAFTTA